MSETPSEELREPETPPEEPRVSRQPLVLEERSPWIAPISLGVAAIAVLIAIWALVMAWPSNSGGSFTGEQTAVAKSRACAAADVVRTAVKLQTHVDLGTDPVAVQAVNANARLALSAGGSYLLAHLDPATPAQLGDAMRSFAGDVQDLSMYAQAGFGYENPSQARRLQDADAAQSRVAELCK